MSDTTADTSDIKQAADHVDVQDIKINLQDSQSEQQPQHLEEEETVPFIDENLRTDK